MSVVEPEAGGGDEDGPVAGVGGENEDGEEEEEEGGEEDIDLHCGEVYGGCWSIDVVRRAVSGKGKSAWESDMEGQGLSEESSADSTKYIAPGSTIGRQDHLLRTIDYCYTVVTVEEVT